MKLFRKVAVGGTFDVLHSGHIKLLSTAVKYGSKVVVGVTSDEFARRIKPYAVKPATIRAVNVVKLVSAISRDGEIEIEMIDSPYGSVLDDDEFDAIVVSIETLPRAFEINRLRLNRGKRPLHIIVIPMIRDGYGVKISSRIVREHL